MSDILSASIDVCVPSAIALHREHKARLRRIAARAVIPPPDPARPAPQQSPPKEIVPDETTVSSDFCCAGWFKRQEQLNPLPELADAAPIPIRKIQQACAILYGTTVMDIVSARRSKEIVRPRMVAIYLSKEMTKRSFPDIGKHFGDRDHTTVLHSFRKIERLCKTDSQLAAEVEAIRARLS